MSEIARALRHCVERIRQVETAGLNATLALDEREVERQLANAPGPPLLGAPIAIKDNIATLEYPTTCASRILENYRSPFEATAVTRLKAAGGVVVCKTNMDEFGMGSSTEHSAFGRCRHPTHPDRVPGGSSGGSAALVATGAVEFALGSETGGSVRQPAAFCGVVGLKPSYGRVSRFGLVAFGSSLDQIGVLARTVRDVGAIFEIISGRDERDATCQDEDPVRVTWDRSTSLRGVVIGTPREYFPRDLDPDVRAGCDRALDAMRDAGATIREVSLPHSHLAVPCYYVIAPAEASSNLARYDGVRYGVRPDSSADVSAMYRETRGRGFGPEVRRRIIVGTYVLSAGYYDAYYRKAQTARGLIASDFASVFSSGVDLLFTPTTPGPAFRAGERIDDPIQMYLGDQFVCAANLAGIPALSIPIGRAEGLPIGGQLIAPFNGEARLLELAAVAEGVIDGNGAVR